MSEIKIGDLVYDADDDDYCIVSHIKNNRVYGYWTQTKEEAIEYKDTYHDRDLSAPLSRVIFIEQKIKNWRRKICD